MVVKINAGPFNTNTNPALIQQTMYNMIANPVTDQNVANMVDDEFVYPPTDPQGP